MRVAFKKDQLRVIGLPERTPVPCSVCGGRGWAVLKEGRYVTHCVSRACEEVENQVINCPHASENSDNFVVVEPEDSQSNAVVKVGDRPLSQTSSTPTEDTHNDEVRKDD
jgi:hypothetical protein